jgi:hypothetical protein
LTLTGIPTRSRSLQIGKLEICSAVSSVARAYNGKKGLVLGYGYGLALAKPPTPWGEIPRENSDLSNVTFHVQPPLFFGSVRFEKTQPSALVEEENFRDKSW